MTCHLGHPIPDAAVLFWPFHLPEFEAKLQGNMTLGDRLVV